MAADRLIAAGSLDTVDGSDRTLATEARGGGAGGAGGSGAFGKVGTYRYHGATVAVKELKARADEESIGALILFGCVVLRPTVSAPAYPCVFRLSSWCATLWYLCYVGAVPPPPPLLTAKAPGVTPMYDVLAIIDAMEALAIDTAVVSAVANTVGTALTATLDSLTANKVPIMKVAAVRRAVAACPPPHVATTSVRARSVPVALDEAASCL